MLFLAPILLGTISAMHFLGTPESQSHSGNVVALVLILMSAVLPYGWLRSRVALDMTLIAEAWKGSHALFYAHCCLPP